MEVTETKEELAEIALRVSPQLINLKDIYAADYIFSAGYYAEDAADWGRARFGAMMTYAAGYIAGIRAERRKRKEKAARHADAERRKRSVLVAGRSWHLHRVSLLIDYITSSR